MADVLQRTLDGGEQLPSDIEQLREIPETFMWCEECETRVLRRFRFKHPHELVESENVDEGSDESTEITDDSDDGDEEVAGVYRVERSYVVRETVTVVAASKSQAEDRYENIRDGVTEHDSDLTGYSPHKYGEAMHTDTDCLRALTRNDVNDKSNDYDDRLTGWPW